CVISTAGLPVSLSMLISTYRESKQINKIRDIYKSALVIFLSLGTIGSVLMLAFSRQISLAIENQNAVYCLIAIAPALLLVCLSSAIRGYCQGFEYMTPTAVSQLIEAVCKLIFGILFSIFAINKGYPVFAVSAFAVFGISVGSFASLIYLAVVKSLKRPERSITAKCHRSSNSTGRGVTRELIAIALPITLGSAVLGLTRIIDMTLIMRRFAQMGVPIAESNKIYGAYTTLAVPVFSLIPALITPVSMALVPQLAAFAHRRDSEGERTVIENSLRLTVLLSMPASFGVTLFSRPILELLFARQSEAIAISVPLLSALGASVLFSCLITTTNAILQSYRHVCLPIISMALGVIVKLVSTYILLGIEEIGVLGAPIGSLLCNISVVAINLCFMHSKTSASLRAAAVFFKPLAASCVSVGGAFALYLYVYGYTGSVLTAFVPSIALALMAYVVISFLIGSLTLNDVMLLPFGEKIASVIHKNKNKRSAVLHKTDSEGDKNDCC
ncbi:MAG: oligosaccharide flippase family protein, partial [Clostridia bacterium]|nr:oligosaccharide flippase family protein [Clostridia bacterium]